MYADVGGGPKEPLEYVRACTHAPSAFKTLSENAFKTLSENAFKTLSENAFKTLSQNAFQTLSENACKTRSENAFKTLRKNAFKTLRKKTLGARDTTMHLHSHIVRLLVSTTLMSLVTLFLVRVGITQKSGGFPHLQSKRAEI